MAKIIGEAAIRLRAESKTLGPEIRRLVTTAIRDASKDIKPETDGITDGIRQDAERTSSRVRSILGGLGASLSSVSSGLLQATLKAVKLAVTMAALASAVSGAATLVGGLGQAIAGLGAAAAGVAVAGLTALIALSTTLKIATSGMGEAFSAVASGDAAALQKALKDMAPAARSFVTETAKLKPVFDDIKLATQAALFKDLGTQVLATGKALSSTFKGLFVGIATQVNEAASQVLKFLREARTVNDLTEISKNVTGGFREMSQAGRSVAQIIVDIVKSASKLLPGLGRSIEDLTKKFAAFIRLKSDSGELTQFFKDGIETVKQFGRIIRDLGVGISNVFKIGSETSGGFLDNLERVVSAFRDWTESIGGQVVLRRLFDVIETLGGSFGRLLNTLKPVLEPLSEFLTLLSEGAASILDRIGPQLRDTLIALLENLIESLPTLIPLIGDMAEGFLKLIEDLAPAIPLLAKLLDGISDIISPTGLAVIAIGALGGKFGLLAAASVLLGIGLASVIKGIKNLNEDGRVSTKVIDFLLEDILKLGPNASKGVNGIIDVIIFTATGRAPEVKRAGKDLMTALAEGIDLSKTDFISGVKNAMNEALTLLSGGKSTFEQGGMSLMQAVNQGWQTQDFLLQQAVNSSLQGVLGILGIKTNDFATQGANMGRAFTNSLTAEQRKAIDQVRATIQALLDAISGKKSEFEQQGRDISRSLGGGIAAERSPQDAARAAVGQVAGVFSNVSLFEAGSSIMASLRSGIVSGIQAVKNVLTSMTSLIPTWKGPLDKDRTLLTPAGKAIMGGLISSIASEIPALRSTLARVTDEITTALNPPGGMALDFRPGLPSSATVDGPTGAGTFILQQTNNMLPGADVNQFADAVWRRGAAELVSGNTQLSVSQRSIQSGLAAPGSVISLGV